MTSAVFPISSAVSGHFDYRVTTGSTNTDLVAEASALPDHAVIASLDQRAGRGRLDRAWSSPAGQTLAASVLLRPRGQGGEPLGDDDWAWFPLLAGTALHGAIGDLLPDADVTLKWPNDVQIRGLKVSGLLAELVIVDGRAGCGRDGLRHQPHDPARAPSDAHFDVARDRGCRRQRGRDRRRRLRGLPRAARSRSSTLLAEGGEEAVRDAVTAACAHPRPPRARRAARRHEAYGLAEALGDGGRLVVLEDDSGGVCIVAAGDVTHLRYE